MQQQAQRGVSSLQSAVSAASNGVARPAMAGSPTPAQHGSYSQQGGAFGAADLKRGGPVEFNHAISYVNKIKAGVFPAIQTAIVNRHSTNCYSESLRSAARNLQAVP